MNPINRIGLLVALVLIGTSFTTADFDSFTWVYPSGDVMPGRGVGAVTQVCLTPNCVLQVGIFAMGLAENHNINVTSVFNDVYAYNFLTNRMNLIVPANGSPVPPPRGFSAAWPSGIGKFQFFGGAYFHFCNLQEITQPGACEGVPQEELIALYNDVWEFDLFSRVWTKIEPTGDVPVGSYG